MSFELFLPREIWHSFAFGNDSGLSIYDVFVLAMTCRAFCFALLGVGENSDWLKSLASLETLIERRAWDAIVLGLSVGRFSKKKVRILVHRYSRTLICSDLSTFDPSVWKAFFYNSIPCNRFWEEYDFLPLHPSVLKRALRVCNNPIRSLAFRIALGDETVDIPPYDTEYKGTFLTAWAVAHGRLNLLRRLVEAGHSISFKCLRSARRTKNGLFFRAVGLGHIAIMEYLFPLISPWYMSDPIHSYGVFVASFSRQHDMLDALLHLMYRVSNVEDCACSLLTCVLNDGDVECLDVLLKYCDVQHAHAYHIDCRTFMEQDAAPKIALLMEKDIIDPAEFYKVGQIQESLVHLAAGCGVMDVITMLIEHKDIDVNLYSRTEGTPTYRALRSGHPEVAIKLICDGGARPHNDDMADIWMMACITNGWIDAMMAMFSICKPSLFASCVTTAARTPDPMVLVAFLNNVPVKQSTLDALLVLTAGCDLVMQSRILLLCGANVNTRLETLAGSATPMERAADRGNREMIQLLAQAGGRVTETALLQAERNNRLICHNLLMQLQ